MCSCPGDYKETVIILLRLFAAPQYSVLDKSMVHNSEYIIYHPSSMYKKGNRKSAELE